MLKFLILSLLFKSSFWSTPDHWKFASLWDNNVVVFGNQLNDITMVVHKSLLKGRVRKGGKTPTLPLLMSAHIHNSSHSATTSHATDIVSVTQMNLGVFCTTDCLVKESLQMPWNEQQQSCKSDATRYALLCPVHVLLPCHHPGFRTTQNCTGLNFFTETPPVSLWTGF